MNRATCLRVQEGGNEAQPMTLAAFAWGGVWSDSFLTAFSHAHTRAVLRDAARSGRSAVVLGSSLGFEAYVIALTFGLPTIGMHCAA